MRWAITHRPQDLPRSKHTLAEGKTLEEVTFIDRRSYRSNAKPESCEEMIDFFSGLQNPWIYSNQVRGQEIFCNACENAQVFEMRDSLNLIQSNDLGAEWTDHHTDLLLSFALAIWNGKSRVTYP